MAVAQRMTCGADQSEQRWTMMPSKKSLRSKVLKAIDFGSGFDRRDRQRGSARRFDGASLPRPVRECVSRKLDRVFASCGRRVLSEHVVCDH